MEIMMKTGKITIASFLRKFIDVFLKDNNQIKKEVFFKIKEEFFVCKFVIGGKEGYNSEIMNGSHDALIIYQLENFIKNYEFDNNEIILHFNYDNDISFKIICFIQEIPEILMDSESQANLEQQRFEESKKREKARNMDKLNKLYRIIYVYPEGISLGELIQKTRFIKDPNIRIDMLEELKTNKKIYMETILNRGKEKKIYRPL